MLHEHSRKRNGLDDTDQSGHDVSFSTTWPTVQLGVPTTQLSTTPSFELQDNQSVHCT